MASTPAESVQVLQLYAHALAYFVRDLARYELNASGLPDVNGPVSEADKKLLQPVLESCDGVTEFFWMPATAARKERMVVALASEHCAYSELTTQLRMLREALEDELQHLLVLYMPPGQAAHFYAGALLLGEDTAGRFPGIVTDIDEAGKCLGSGRYTASVFHLMRVMEVGVQEFGAALGVSLLDEKNVEKNWHNILEEADKAIRLLPKGDTRRPALAELSALLSAVKLAWRNEVMHPKASYDPDEAENVFLAVKGFMGHLALLV